ncbi:hypothetical protein KBC75_04860 [Candidatus Shapirobacteria bacterium]|nr:hypothetical protein [Candidatus Shapirobacteria bacterium]
MIQKQAQIKINLPAKFKNKVEKRAGSYDLTLAGYIKHLMMMDLKAGIPVYHLSKRSIEALKEAKKEDREGKLREITNIDEFFAKMSK